MSTEDKPMTKPSENFIFDAREDVDRFFCWSPEKNKFTELSPHSFDGWPLWKGPGIHSLAARWDGEKYTWTVVIGENSGEAIFQFIKLYNTIEPPTREALARIEGGSTAEAKAKMADEDALAVAVKEDEANQMTFEEAKALLQPCGRYTQYDTHRDYALEVSWPDEETGEAVAEGMFSHKDDEDGCVEILGQRWKGGFPGPHSTFRGRRATELLRLEVDGEILDENF